jgi:hypothetical protein
VRSFHPVVDGRDNLVGARRDDGRALDDLAGGLVGPEAGEGERLISREREADRLLTSLDELPLVEAVGEDQAAPRAEEAAVGGSSPTDRWNLPVRSESRAI